MEYNINKNVVDGDFFESLCNNDNVVYYKQDQLNLAFNAQNHHKILITHNSDINITETIYKKFMECKKYDYWFAQNVCCVHNNLIPIPIGLERPRRCKFNKYNIIKKCIDKFTGLPDKILYANFSIGTKIDERKKCIESFDGCDYITNKVSMFTPSNENLTERQYEDYCMDILSHKFVLCPCGNGIDTHRMWETLYLGRIPVVLHNPTNDCFKKMPILILNNWREFDLYINKDITGSLEELNTEYWKNLIINTLRK